MARVQQHDLLMADSFFIQYIADSNLVFPCFRGDILIARAIANGGFMVSDINYRRQQFVPTYLVSAMRDMYLIYENVQLLEGERVLDTKEFYQWLDDIGSNRPILSNNLLIHYVGNCLSVLDKDHDHIYFPVPDGTVKRMKLAYLEQEELGKKAAKPELPKDSLEHVLKQLESALDVAYSNWSDDYELVGEHKARTQAFETAIQIVKSAMEDKQ